MILVWTAMLEPTIKSACKNWMVEINALPINLWHLALKGLFSCQFQHVCSYKNHVRTHAWWSKNHHEFLLFDYGTNNPIFATPGAMLKNMINSELGVSFGSHKQQICVAFFPFQTIPFERFHLLIFDSGHRFANTSTWLTWTARTLNKNWSSKTWRAKSQKWYVPTKGSKKIWTPWTSKLASLSATRLTYR